MVALLPLILLGGLVAASVGSRKKSKRQSMSDWEIIQEEWFRLQDRGDFESQERIINAMFDPSGGHVPLISIVYDIANRSPETGYIREQLMWSYADVTPEQQDLLLWWALERVDKFPTQPKLGHQYLNIINEILVNLGEEPIVVMEF